MKMPTPPPLSNDNEQLWLDYVTRALAFVTEAVEHTETRGISCTVQFEIPHDSRVVCHAYFCFDCSALHVESQWYEGEAELRASYKYDPAEIRERMRELESRR